MPTLYLLSVWLHILAAAVWMGGMVFLALVLVPLTRRLQDRKMATWLIHQTGVRFRWIGWGCLGLLVATGVWNLSFRGFGWSDLWSGKLFQGSFGHLLALKLFLVAWILALGALHDFWIGPRATALGRENPGGVQAGRLRRQASWLGRLLLLLSLAVLVLAIRLVRG